jgi:hypothetical protein
VAEGSIPTQGLIEKHFSGKEYTQQSIHVEATERRPERARQQLNKAIKLKNIKDNLHAQNHWVFWILSIIQYSKS